jgi:hypothetical protein
MRRTSLALAVLAFLAAGAGPLEGGQGLEKRKERFSQYLEKLRALAAEYAQGELRLSAWCRAREMNGRAEAALGRARGLDAGLEDPGASGEPAPPGDPEAAYGARLLKLRGDVSRAYTELGKWCLSKKLTFEARRCVEKALRWDRRNAAAKSLAHRSTLRAKALYARLCTDKKGVWKGERFVPEADWRKAAERRVARLVQVKTKEIGLPFRGDFLPGFDILTTVDEETFRPVREQLGKYLAHVRLRYFLRAPLKPVQFYYLRDQAEFKKTGQTVQMIGAYEWGKQKLYVYPGPMGQGTVLHEMTHAMLEANFRSFPPLWLNEGLACFFETYHDLGEKEPFGWVNWRDAYYGVAVNKGEARSLPVLLRECAMKIDMLGYGQGRALVNYLYSLGQLEAYVLSLQLLDDRKLNFGKVLSELLLKPIEEIGRELEAFARPRTERGKRVVRGQRPDDEIDAPMGEGPGQD